MAVSAALLRSRLLWVAVGALFLWSSGRILARGLQRDARFVAFPERFTAEAPRWCGRGPIERIAKRLEAMGPVSLFHPSFERRVREAVAADACVEAVAGVRRVWPNAFAVDVVLRRPYAKVAGVPVTREGVVLPAAPYEESCRGLFEVRGVAISPPREGERWRDARLGVALAALDELAPHLSGLERLGLFAIDVSGAGDPRAGVVLLGANGLSVRWGRPGAPPGENPPAKKADFLKIAATSPHPLQGLELDLRYAELVLRKSLAP